MKEVLRRHADRLAAAAIFTLMLLVFLTSQVHQIAESRYALVLTDSLVRRATFDLAPYFRPPFAPRVYPYLGENGYPVNLQTWDGSVYYGYPVGTSILSAPLAIVLQLLGVSSFNADGSYSMQGEERAQAIIAAVLMAALAAVWYFTARLFLPLGASAAIASGAALGTQVWSTASRGLWSHTWLIFLLALVIWMLAKGEGRPGRLHPIVLGTLLSGMYVVSPSASISIVAIVLYLSVTQPRRMGWLLLTCVAWLGLFVAYSQEVYDTFLPPDYALRPYPGGPTSFWRGLSGVLLSPSRGLFLCVPVTLFVVYLVVRYRRTLPVRSLARLAFSAIVLQIGLLACYRLWDGASSFGPRYLTDIVPWFVLLAILGVRARADAVDDAGAAPRRFSRTAELAVGLVLLTLGIVVNGRGATSSAVSQWNAYLAPDPDARRPRVMDWRYPQWLAGLIPPPVPSDLPRYVLGTTLGLGEPESGVLLRESFGWSGPEGVFRRTDGTRAHIVFRIAPVESGILEVRAEPFLASPKLKRQRLKVRLNGLVLATLRLSDPGARIHTIPIPAGVLKENNVLVLELPDARSPAALGLSRDSRKLGIALYWVRISGEPKRSRLEGPARDSNDMAQGTSPGRTSRRLTPS